MGHGESAVAEETSVSEAPIVADASKRADESIDKCPEDGQVALVNGQPLPFPDDLYIPPEALRIFLESFEGPFDLLLYLIRKQKMDIADLPVADITRQYIEYVDLMRELKIDLAAEYLLMAAMLAEIKSRALLPRQEEELSDEGEGTDPRADLIRQLQEYERIKTVAVALGQLPQLNEDFFPAVSFRQIESSVEPQAPIDFPLLLASMKDVVKRAEQNKEHWVEREPLCLQERVRLLIDGLSQTEFSSLARFYTKEEGRLGVSVSVLAALQLEKEQALEISQAQPFAALYVRACKPTGEIII